MRVTIPFAKAQGALEPKLRRIAATFAKFGHVCQTKPNARTILRFVGPNNWLSGLPKPHSWAIPCDSMQFPCVCCIQTCQCPQTLLSNKIRGPKFRACSMRVPMQSPISVHIRRIVSERAEFGRLPAVGRNWCIKRGNNGHKLLGMMGTPCRVRRGSCASTPGAARVKRRATPIRDATDNRRSRFGAPLVI